MQYAVSQVHKIKMNDESNLPLLQVYEDIFKFSEVRILVFELLRLKSRRIHFKHCYNLFEYVCLLRNLK